MGWLDVFEIGLILYQLIRLFLVVLIFSVFVIGYVLLRGLRGNERVRGSLADSAVEEQTVDPSADATRLASLGNPSVPSYNGWWKRTFG